MGWGRGGVTLAFFMRREMLLEYLTFFKTKNMLSNLGYCRMHTTLKYLGQRITKNIKKISTAHHKEYFGKERIV